MKLGDSLKAARESKELTVQAVADAIHLSVKQINALEANNFNLLPEPVTTRGFIRSYARFLEIDSEPLLHNYRELVPHQDPNSLVMSASVNKVISQQEQTPWLMYILGSIVVLLLLVVWFYYMDNVNDWSVDSEESLAVESQVIAEASLSEEKAIEEDVVDERLLASNQGENVLEETPENVSLPSVPMPEVKEALVLKLSKPCWVGIKTLDGKTFFEKLLPAGTEQAFDIQAPFKLKIGNAGAVTATYHTKKLDLSRYTKGSVARVTVDEALLAKMPLIDELADMGGTPIEQEKMQPTSSGGQQAEASTQMPNDASLVIKTTEDCWVSVRNSNGVKVFEQLLPAGSNQTIAVSKPFKLTIGNASAAQANYDNEALDLELNKQHNVARLSVN